VGNLSFNFAQLQPAQRYKLLCGLVVPRPIALVTSMSPDGVVNAAPFSFFNVFSENPALLVLGLQHNEDGSPKDTTRNIHLSGEFVVNLVDEGIAEAMNLTATDFPPGEGEPTALGIATMASTLVKPPRLAQSPAAFECRRTVGLAFGPQRELLIAKSWLGKCARALSTRRPSTSTSRRWRRSDAYAAAPTRASATGLSSNVSPTRSGARVAAGYRARRIVRRRLPWRRRPGSGRSR
jgi:flavin reductase (DIM6/NTAB) family NADH-FMN oxidoreductase RutF